MLLIERLINRVLGHKVGHFLRLIHHNWLLHQALQLLSFLEVDRIFHAALDRVFFGDLLVQLLVSHVQSVRFVETVLVA